MSPKARNKTLIREPLMIFPWNTNDAYPIEAIKVHAVFLPACGLVGFPQKIGHDALKAKSMHP